VVYGAFVGGVIALVAVAILGGRFGLQAAVATPLAEGSPRASVEFVASSGGMYLIVVTAAVLTGLLVGGIMNAVGRELEPDSPKFPIGWLLPVAGLASGITGYAVVRAGLGLASDINAGVVVVSVVSFVLIALVSGLISGAVTTYIVDRLARPDLLGLGGAAWPTSTGELMGAMARAVGIPLVAVTVAGVFAIGLAQVLLTAEGTLAVVLFSLAAALVLGGAALIAYRPWERDGDGATG
jgi:hypothetical protein